MAMALWRASRQDSLAGNEELAAHFLRLGWSHPGEAIRCSLGYLDSERSRGIGLLFWLPESLMEREMRP